MKKAAPIAVEIIINIVVSLIAWYVFNYVIYSRDNPNEFMQGFAGFLIFYIAITVLDIVWKLIKKQIRNMRKK